MATTKIGAMRCACLRFVCSPLLGAQTYDIVLTGGRVLDPKNGVDAPLDVGVTDGRVTAVEANIDPSDANSQALQASRAGRRR